MKTIPQVEEYQEATREYDAKAREMLSLDEKRREAKTSEAGSWTDADQDKFDELGRGALDAKAHADELKNVATFAQDVEDMGKSHSPVSHNGAAPHILTLREALFGADPQLTKATAVDGTGAESYMVKGIRYDTGLRLSRKDAADGIALGSGNAADSLVVPTYGGLTEYPVPPTVADQLFGAGRTAVNVWKYYMQDAPDFAAASVGNTLTNTTTKPKSSMSFELITETAHVIAHYIPVHKTALRNIPQLESIVRNQLLVGLALELDRQVIWGEGTNDEILGLTERGASVGGIPGIQLHTSAGLTDTKFLDDIKAMATKSFTKSWIAPTVAGMTPAEADVLLTAKSSGSGEYVYGVIPFMAANGALVISVWGLKIIQSPVFLNPDTGAGTVIVGNPVHGTVVTQDDANVTVGWVDKQFIQNAETLLAEETAGLEVIRPYGYVEMDVVGAS